jgi:hypothetical protein
MHHYVVADLGLEGNPGGPIDPRSLNSPPIRAVCGEQLVEGIPHLSFERSLCGNLRRISRSPGTGLGASFSCTMFAMISVCDPSAFFKPPCGPRA